MILQSTNWGTLEEFGLPPVTESVNLNLPRFTDSDTLNIPEISADTTVLGIGETVRNTVAINDIADVFGDGIPVAGLEYPKPLRLPPIPV